ncbi:MAG TPA: hypothetical protein VMZ30_11605 [Pyrinomonadaceae bacterium]|nr:hypothetical protein [Pyrinomonadaceae bacterium]
MHRIAGDKPVARRNNLGLGLYSTDRIVVAQGGSIQVESAIEKGNFHDSLTKDDQLSVGVC